MRKLRVLWLFPHRPRIVAERLGETPLWRSGWLEASLSALHATGVEATVACFTGDIFDPFTVDSVTYISCYSSSSDKPTVLSTVLPYYVTRLLQTNANVTLALSLIERESPDIIHVHGVESTLGLVCEITRIPLVVSLQGFSSALYPVFYGRCSVLRMLLSSVSARYLIKGLRGHGVFWNKYYCGVQAKIENRILRSARYYMGKTDYDHAMVLSRNPNARYWRQVIPIRSTTEAKEWCIGNSNNCTIFTITGSYPFKGMDVLVHAFYIAKKVLKVPLQLRIAGMPCEETVSTLKKRKYYKEICDCVSYLGPMSYDDIDKEMLCSRMFIMPSFMENESHALLEAMRLGVPSITSSVGGVTSFAISGDNCLMFSPGNHIELAGQIVRLCLDPAYCEKISEQSKSTIRLIESVNFSEQLYNVYREIFDNEH